MKQTQMPPKLIIAYTKEGHFSFNEVSSLPSERTNWQSITGPLGECDEVRHLVAVI